MAAENTLEPMISLQVYPIAKKKNYLMSFTSSTDTTSIKRDLSRDFLELRLARSKRGTYVYGVKRGHGVMDSITQSGNIPIFPIFAYNREEHFLFLSESKDKTKRSLESIADQNSLSFTSTRQIKTQELLDIFSNASSFFNASRLTSTELKVVKEAFSSGYYEWPRRNDLGQVSNFLKLSKPTVLYHIRNAEKKIIGSLLKDSE